MTDVKDIKADPADEFWMRQALETAKNAELIAPPNPAVGCVIVKDGVELGRGSTQAPGSAHAEISAINDVYAKGMTSEGATFYVTLEPCSHYGRTPPCALRLIKEKAARVVVGTTDPNPLVAGRGIAMLKDAGIAVTTGVCETEAIESNIGFITRMKRGTPWVRMKLAASLDGRTALENGMSRWITSEDSREDGRLMRAHSQGILTGVGTVRADNPQMNVRLPGNWKDPPKFVCDARGSIPSESRILEGAPCTVFVAESASEEAVERITAAGAQTVRVAETELGKLDLGEVLHEIGKREVNVLHVEAGARLSGSLMTAGLVDEIVLYVAPCFMGSGKVLASLPHFERMQDIYRWRYHAVATAGSDLKIVLRPQS